MKDKIINHLIAREILYPALLPCLVPYNVASRPGMGTRKALEFCLEKIKEFLAKEKLVLNNKTRIYASNQNICFLGRNLYGQYAKRITVRRRMKRRRYLLKEGKISLNSYIASKICYEKLMREA